MSGPARLVSHETDQTKDLGLNQEHGMNSINNDMNPMSIEVPSAHLKIENL
jgi:hypothetical protein